MNNIILQRRRLQRRKDILEGFRQLLENEAFENKDEKAADKENALLYEYDAFVSYCRSPNDENFVYQMLEVKKLHVKYFHELKQIFLNYSNLG